VRPGARSDAVRLIALLPLFLALIALAPPVYTRGEAREGLVVQGLLTGGDWIAPRREGILASKPPLFHWIAASTARLVGRSDFALRFPSAVGAWGMVVATFMLGMALFDRRRAWLAVGVLLATMGFWRPTIEARVDMLFAAAVTVALAGFAHWQRTAHGGARLTFFLGCAAAVLTKGPIGVVLPGAIVVAAHLWARDVARLRELWAPGPVCAAAALVLGWYGLAYYRAGQEFLAVQLLHENLERAVGLGSFARQRREHPLKLVGSFITWLVPWNAVALATWRQPSSWQSRLLHAWWIVTLAFFTIAAGKRSVYLLPLYPAIALLAADWIHARVDWRPWLAVVLGSVGALLAALNVAMARHEAARSPLRAFADAVQAAVPATASVGARGVEENERLVLAYRLGRPLPRLDRAAPDPSFLVTRRAEGTRRRHCEPRVSWAAGDGGLVLLACPFDSGREQGR
jgi:4-amino-4-deoxy-L-arabinose transferase-like glycosyltransferase